MSEVEILENEMCPYCHNKTLTLTEQELDVPYFGITHVFSMDCSSCGYFMSDVEFDKKQGKVRVSFTVENEDDLKVRVIKSSAATVKIPRMVDIKPGATSNGYITNVEGLLNRFKKVLEELRQDPDKAVANKAKNQLKKLKKVLWGQDKLTIILEDPTGNSAILSDKAK